MFQQQKECFTLEI